MDAEAESTQGSVCEPSNSPAVHIVGVVMLQEET